MIGLPANTTNWSTAIARTARQGRLRQLLAAVRNWLIAADPVAARMRQARVSLERAARQRRGHRAWPVQPGR